MQEQVGLAWSRPEVAFVVWPNKDDALSQAMGMEKNLRVSGL